MYFSGCTRAEKQTFNMLLRLLSKWSVSIIKCLRYFAYISNGNPNHTRSTFLEQFSNQVNNKGLFEVIINNLHFDCKSQIVKIEVSLLWEITLIELNFF